MASLMLINPTKKKSSGGRKKPRTAAQKAATKKLVALNRGKGRPARPSKKRAASTTVTVLRSNPIGLARVSKRRVARRRNNPLSLGGIGKGVVPLLSASAQGAAGAFAVTTALNYMPFLPAALNSGNGKYLARIAASVALGVLGGKVLPKGVAQNMAVGSITVAMHDLLLGIATQKFPTMRLGDVGDYDTGVSAYEPNMAAYADNGMSGMGDVYEQNEY